MVKRGPHGRPQASEGEAQRFLSPAELKRVGEVLREMEVHRPRPAADPDRLPARRLSPANRARNAKLHSIGMAAPTTRTTSMSSRSPSISNALPTLDAPAGQNPSRHDACVGRLTLTLQPKFVGCVRAHPEG